MRFAGIDYNSHRIDVVTVDLDTDAPEWHTYPLGGPLAGDAFDRARNVRRSLPTLSVWEDMAVVLFAIEHPKSRHFRSTAALARVQGAIVACLPAAVPVLELTPAEWKQAVDLKPNSRETKADAAAKSVELGGDPDWPQHAHDAHLIARAAIRICDYTNRRKEGGHPE